MQFLHGKSTIDFMGKRKIALIFSLTLVIASLISIVIDGLNFGIDFTGGYLIEVGYERDIDIAPIRKALIENGYEDAQVQHFGTARDILVRIAPRKDINKASISDELLGILKANTDQQITMRRVEFVGPQVGEELREQGGLALLVALGGILVYISFRFQFKSAVGAILSLIHDVIITVGVFAITQMEFDLTVLAALLAVIGYSLNDTVVVLDRIRETFRSLRKADSLRCSEPVDQPDAFPNPDDVHDDSDRAVRTVPARRGSHTRFRIRADHRYLYRNLLIDLRRQQHADADGCEETGFPGSDQGRGR